MSIFCVTKAFTLSEKVENPSKKIKYVLDDLIGVEEDVSLPTILMSDSWLKVLKHLNLLILVSNDGKFKVTSATALYCPL